MPHHSVCWGWLDSVYRHGGTGGNAGFRFLALLGTMRLPTRNAEGIRAW